MDLQSARITGFQSFSDSGVLNFGPGINLIIGQNNSGKSALLRALLVDIPDDRHRTPAAWIRDGLPIPRTEFSISASGEEIRTAIFLSGLPVIIPVPENAGVSHASYATQLLERENIKIALTRIAGSSFTSAYPSHGQFIYPGHGMMHGARASTRDGHLVIEAHNNNEDTLPALFNYMWRENMFYFSVERFSFGEGPIALSIRLDQSASNLASVLLTMQNEKGDIYRKLIAHLTDIFPNVGNVSVRPLPNANHQLEILIWPTYEQQSVELSFPLKHSGTGVAQTIAILVAIMSVRSAVIIIDEINSFLHPSAVKALLRILQTEYADHQYIISTHAPEVIGFARPSSVHLVKREGYESTVSTLDVARVDHLRFVAAHLGVAMSDVFAADYVIWVEGETEEIILPYIYQELIGSLPAGVIITAVVATGDFGAKRRNRELIYEIYEKLGGAVATMPVKVAFGFDAEALSSEEMQGMRDDSYNAIRFLPRRNLECYFIEPEAIATRINEIDSVKGHTAVDVIALIERLCSARPLQVEGCLTDLDNKEWLSKVDGARLLKSIFGELTETRVEYDKLRDGVELARTILTDKPARLRGLAGYTKELVESVVGV